MEIPINTVKPDIFINFILDESGSMAWQQKAVISGFNEYLQDHKRKTDANYFITLTKFSSTDRILVLYVAKAVGDVQQLTTHDYSPNGGTALYDAIARTVEVTESRMREISTAPRVLNFIFTDGEENASVVYAGAAGAERLNGMITAKEDSGNWTFTFIGATRESLKQAQSIGIKLGNSIQYNPAKFYDTARAMSFATSNYADGVCTRGLTNTTSFFADAGLKNENDLSNAAKIVNSLTPTVTTSNQHIDTLADSIDKP